MCGRSRLPSWIDRPAIASAGLAAVRARAADRGTSGRPSPRTRKSTPDAGVLVRLRREAGIVPAGDDRHLRLDRANQADDSSAVRRWNVITERPTTSGSRSRISRSTVGPHLRLRRGRDRRPTTLMVPIDIAGERRQRAVRHPHRQRRRVLERVRHREEQVLASQPRFRSGSQFSAVSNQLSAISSCQLSRVLSSSQFSVLVVGC